MKKLPALMSGREMFFNDYSTYRIKNEKPLHAYALPAIIP
jgi:hypothetical protein